MQDKENQEYLNNLRHTAAHALNAAIRSIWSEAKNTIGPSIENGFYHDFDMGDMKVSETDFPKIEKRMRQILTQWSSIEEKDVSVEEAKKEFEWNEYKLEMIDDIVNRGGTPKLQILGNFIDLCRGGHLDNPAKELRHFKLLSVAGAYWKGDENNKMLTRVYGTAFKTKEDLNNHLEMLEEAKKRDHRILGKQLDLFFIDEMVGKGLITWLPKGNIVKEEIENLAKQMEDKAGYQRVTTPHIAKKELFLTSGHLPYYEDDMYPPMEMDDGTYYLKAMNCPHHHRVFQHSQRSYKELPLRIAEYGTVYRNEMSGTLAGLLRVRGMDMNDAHIYCSKEQIKPEFKKVMELTKLYFDIFGLKDYWFRLSKWDPERKEKYIDEPENWDYTQQVLKEVLDEMGVDYDEVDDEAAFYGPKVDVQFKSVVGREESMSTIQLDFLAKERFGLSYVDSNGEDNNEVFVIHRAPLSVHERFIAFLIEHYAGAFPLWLAPVQVVVLPVSEKHNEIAEKVATQLREGEIRVEVDVDNKTLPAKIRRWTLQKAPFMCIIGEKEAQKSNSELHISVRTRKGKDEGLMSLEVFLQKLQKNIEKKV